MNLWWRITTFTLCGLLFGSCAAKSDLEEVARQRDSALEEVEHLKSEMLSLESELQSAGTELQALTLEVASLQPRPLLREVRRPDIQGDPVRAAMLGEALTDCSNILALSPDYRPDLTTSDALYSHCGELLGELLDLMLTAQAGGYDCPNRYLDAGQELDWLDAFIGDAFTVELVEIYRGEPYVAEEAIVKVFLACGNLG